MRSQLSDEDTHPSHPSPGGLLHLQVRLRNVVAWLGPAWATLCGVVASGAFDWTGTHWLRLFLVILLTDAGWGTLWAGLAATDWASPLRRWQHWWHGHPFPAPPYSLPGSPSDRVARWLGQLRVWWADALWPTAGSAISGILVAIPVTLALSAVLGPHLLLLTAAALALMQLGVAWSGGQGEVASGWDAALAVMLPWLAGHVAFGSLELPSVGLALAYAVATTAGYRANRWWGRLVWSGAQVGAALWLILLQQPLAAGLLALLLVPQMALAAWLGQGRPMAWFLRHTRPWLMAAMLVAAWAVP